MYNMTQVAKLSVNSSSVGSHGFTRCPDLDFKDDGNRFTGWMWNGTVPLTQCVSGGETFLSVRDDYMRSNAGIPYQFWKKYEESKLSDEYNGTTEIDLDELADICRKIDAGIKKAKEDFDAVAYPDLSNRIQRYMVGIEKAEALLNRNLNWSEMNLNSSGIEEAYRTYDMLKKALNKDRDEVRGMADKTISKASAYSLSCYNDEARCEYYVNQLNELIDQKSYSWYYEVKAPTMK